MANNGPVLPSYDQPIDVDGKLATVWYRFFAAISPPLTFTGTVTLVKLTGGGSNGTLTFTNGLLTKVVQPT